MFRGIGICQNPQSQFNFRQNNFIVLNMKNNGNGIMTGKSKVLNTITWTD